MRIEDDPEVQRKARRVLVVLYVLMFVFIALPFVLWWLRGF